jgi:hypothetical protein
MQRLGGVVLIAVLGGVAHGQGVPAEPPAPAPAPAPAPPPAPAPYSGPYAGPSAIPPPYAYRPPPIQLTAEDQELLAEGEMPVGQHAAGGALAFVLGLGTGHMVQGRWLETGWIFTLGEAASVAAIIYGASKLDLDCVDSDPKCHNGDAIALMVGGLVASTGFRVWEVLDAFIVPANRNRRVRDLRARLGQQPPPYSFYVAPHAGGGGQAGLVLRF